MADLGTRPGLNIAVQVCHTGRCGSTQRRQAARHRVLLVCGESTEKSCGGGTSQMWEEGEGGHL